MKAVYLKPESVAKYAILPGILPRLKGLFGSFGFLPFLLAQVYGSFGLLPSSHPYLQEANIGRYGIIKLVAAAGNQLTWKREYIDRIILYLASVAAMIMFVLMLISCAVYALIPQVAAAGIFITPYPENDIAFMLLDRIIGVPGIYDSCVTTSGQCRDILSGTASEVRLAPWPFHYGLFAMFRLYSSALFVIALVYFLYYIFSIVGETAITGTPFGKRFHKVWSPLRLVIALGLLLPFGSYGLNSAQYIILYTAKFASGMATNGWIEFNKVAANPFSYGTQYTGRFPDRTYVQMDGSEVTLNPGTYRTHGLAAVPEIPDVSGLAGHINLIHTCIRAYDIYHNKEIKPYIVNSSGALEVGNGSVSLNQALAFSEYRGIEVVFGHFSEEEHENDPGNVYPYCGSVLIPAVPGGQFELGEIRSLFFDLVTKDAFNPSNPDLYYPPYLYANKLIARYGSDYSTPKQELCNSISSYPPLDDCQTDTSGIHRQYYASALQRSFDARAYTALRRFLQGETAFNVPEELLKYGWGGTGIWYNRITDLNSDLFQAFKAIPEPKELPVIMEYVRGQRFSFNENTTSEQQFEVNIPGEDRSVRFNDQKNAEIAGILNRSWQYWNLNDIDDGTTGESRHNLFIRAVAYVFGADPILSIRENENVHPFAQLTAVGKGLIENAIRALGMAGASSFAAGVLNAAGDGLGAGFSGGTGILKAIAFAGLTAGFLLFYVVPFMPFLYFFFGVGAWVKSIFEAMVGAPLWALAHMKADGDSLFSKEAQGGYFLVLEIFTRPIMIVVGLIASAAIFGAEVTVLNSIFDLATYNLTSTQLDGRGEITMGDVAYYRGMLDQLFFTLMYVILVYLMATSSFKLVDLIPDNIIRWINGGVKSFGDTAKDPAEQLTTYASIAGYRFAPQVGEGVTGIGEAAGGMVGGSMAEQTRRMVLGGASSSAAAAAATQPGQPTTGDTPRPTPQPADQTGGADSTPQGGEAPADTDIPTDVPRAETGQTDTARPEGGEEQAQQQSTEQTQDNGQPAQRTGIGGMLDSIGLGNIWPFGRGSN